MYKFAFQHLLLLFSCVPCIAFEYPTNYTTNLAPYSTISVSSTCSNSDKDACNLNCLYRNDFPSFQKPLQKLSSGCQVFSGPLPNQNVNVTNGGIMFNSLSTGCLKSNSSLSSTSPYYFSLTMWVNASCNTTCTLINPGIGITVTYSYNTLSLSTTTTTKAQTASADQNTWHFVVLRYNGAVTWFVNGTKPYSSTLPFSRPSSYAISLGPGKSLTDSDYIILTDVRWYNDALTDREILYIYNRKSLDIAQKWECRCPATHPTLVTSTTSAQKCTNGNTEVPRFEQHTYMKENMLDNNTTTKWFSSTVPEGNITISLDKLFQIKTIRLEGIEHKPSGLKMFLYRSTKQTVVTDVSVSGQTASHNFEAVSVSTRSDYENLVADRIVIQAKFSSKNFFTVSELRIEARCHCYGNDKNCVIRNDAYSCDCLLSSYTEGSHCETCRSEHYRQSNDFTCSNQCNCNTTGRLSNNCEKVGGQCSCKSSITGRTCSTCKNKYFGWSSDNETVCDACECNIVGSADLVCDKTSGACQCVDGRNHTSEGNRECVPGNLHLEPTYGPEAGGTLITLTGTLLGTDANVSFRLDGDEQPVIERNITHIIFRTNSIAIGEKRVSLNWTRGDAYYHAEEIENGTSFLYKINPQLIVPNTNIRSFASGGCTFSTEGSNLDSVARPMMLVHLTNQIYTSSACFSEGKLLKCRTPDLHDQNVNKTYSYGFRMDGVTKYENVTEIIKFFLVVVEDPKVYTGMTETYRNTFDKDFRIKGERLNEACQNSDVTIMLGDKNCPVLSRTQDTITCDPEEDFPGTARTVQVKVKIGNFEKVWGELQINSFWTNTEFIFIAIGAGVFLILVVGLVICIVWCRRRGKYDKYKEDSSTAIEMATSNPKARRLNDYERNPVAIIPPLENQAPERTPKMIAEEFCDRLKKSIGKVVKTSLIERSNIEIGKKCTHKGKKIRIINGQYNASTSSPYSGTGVTIKTLVESYTETGELPEWLSNGLQECTRLQDFVHDNVLRMRGIAVDAKNIYITYPEMSNRTLKDYLVTKPLTTEKKLEICIQIADGMSFLSSNGVAHKDLAARNCWVSNDFEVKISDASFSYDIYPEEYLENNGRYQPVRWMAPESLRQGFYDTKTDVWSFGVVVWEVYTNGHLPYHDIKSNEEIRTKVCDKEFRLGKPHECPELVFRLILECHKSRSDERPDFSGLQKKFDTILYPPAHDEHLYENRAFTSDHADDSLEDYMNTNFIRPLKPQKGRKS